MSEQLTLKRSQHEQGEYPDQTKKPELPNQPEQPEVPKQPETSVQAEQPQKQVEVVDVHTLTPRVHKSLRAYRPVSPRRKWTPLSELPSFAAPIENQKKLSPKDSSSIQQPKLQRTSLRTQQASYLKTSPDSPQKFVPFVSASRSEPTISHSNAGSLNATNDDIKTTVPANIKPPEVAARKKKQRNKRQCSVTKLRRLKSLPPEPKALLPEPSQHRGLLSFLLGRPQGPPRPQRTSLISRLRTRIQRHCRCTRPEPDSVSSSSDD